ncbi:hypothetical protein CEXT_12291 [Caerostris extrusa]|uniref:Uncharacterized protein n=1 Tax=Caerostris extrusa TaxID=172846 RepID=A0AAV4SFL3_CAEEX|nr:hypothetical protein CEXT_12291 [Caerostris extrusa]
MFAKSLFNIAKYIAEVVQDRQAFINSMHKTVLRRSGTIRSSKTKKELCSACQQPIIDRYIMRVMDNSLARGLPHLLRLPHTPLAHLLLQGQEALLQGGLRQVSTSTLFLYPV